MSGSGSSGRYSVVDEHPDDDASLELEQGLGVGVGLGMGPLADSRPTGGRGAVVGAGVEGRGAWSRARIIDGVISRAEWLSTINTRMKNTVTCIVIYVALMVLNVFVMCWEIAGRGWHPAILFVEFLLTLFIVIEVSLALYTQGARAYCGASWMNTADASLAVLCVGFFLLILGRSGGTGSEADAARDALMSELDALLLALRFLFQVARLSVLVWRSRQAARMQQSGQEDVDFNSVSLSRLDRDRDRDGAFASSGHTPTHGGEHEDDEQLQHGGSSSDLLRAAVDSHGGGGGNESLELVAPAAAAAPHFAAFRHATLADELHQPRRFDEDDEGPRFDGGSGPGRRSSPAASAASAGMHGWTDGNHGVAPYSQREPFDGGVVPASAAVVPSTAALSASPGLQPAGLLRSPSATGALDVGSTGGALSSQQRVPSMRALHPLLAHDTMDDDDNFFT